MARAETTCRTGQKRWPGAKPGDELPRKEEKPHRHQVRSRTGQGPPTARGQEAGRRPAPKRWEAGLCQEEAWTIWPSVSVAWNAHAAGSTGACRKVSRLPQPDAVSHEEARIRERTGGSIVPSADARLMVKRFKRLNTICSSRHTGAPRNPVLFPANGRAAVPKETKSLIGPFTSMEAIALRATRSALLRGE